jgi:GTP pyrophosphokinase
MVNGLTVNPHGTLTFESLLEYWDLSGTKYHLRKAFGLMLNASATDQEPGYVQMVLETVQIIIEDLNLGLESVLCCILKNVADKGKLSRDAIEHEFGKSVRTLIEGIHKLERLDTSKYTTNKENFIGLLFTLHDDIRVLLIRLAMRLYDMRHLSDYTCEKQGIVAGEINALYIPIAHRLGLYRIKNELEDRLMRFSNPVIYEQIERKLCETKDNRDQYTSDFISPVAMRLEENGFECEIKSRIKSIPSIYRKMMVQKVEFDKVYDLFAIRIIQNKTIENEAADCWKIYSLVTDIYSPNPGRLRDWISFPKSNGYESLHTTVIGPEGRWVEVQIRSRRMHEVAEKGYAAHWKYKSEDTAADRADLFSKIREQLEHPSRVSLESLITQEKKALYTDDIFVFTPKGDLKKLKVGYSVLDFAFEINSETGSNCTGAIVNGKMVPIKYTLVNGDTVKILTSKAQKPNKGWLDILKSPWNLARVKQALKIESPREPEPGKQAAETPVVASFPENISRIKAGKEDYVIIDSSITSLHYQFAKCCDPAPGNSIFAFVSVTHGIKIHRTSCTNTHQLVTRYPYRVLEARWKEGETGDQRK